MAVEGRVRVGEDGVLVVEDVVEKVILEVCASERFSVCPLDWEGFSLESKTWGRTLGITLSRTWTARHGKDKPELAHEAVKPSHVL